MGGHGNRNGLEFPFPIFPGILRMRMEISNEANFSPFPGILGIGNKNSTKVLFQLFPGI